MSLRDLFLLDPSVVFLNHGSFGACPRSVMAAYQEWQLELERQPVLFFQRRYHDLLAQARAALGIYLGASGEDLIFVSNATAGVNVIARSLRLERGDEVVTTNHEYPACDGVWQIVCDKQGAIYKKQPVRVPVQSAEEVIEEIWSGVTERTRVLFMSHITSPTAVIFPIEELVLRARERGILTVIDGAHAPGQIDLDMRRIGADFYVGNCHKWMMSPKGAGFMYARREVQQLIEPAIISSEWRADEPPERRFIAWQQYQGTRDVAAYLAVEDAIRFAERHNWEDVRQQCHQLVRHARHEIEQLTGLPATTPDSPEWYRQLATFLLPPSDNEALKRRLYDEYRVEIPLTNWNGRHGVRISIQGYNSKEDVDTLVAALKDLLPQTLL